MKTVHVQTVLPTTADRVWQAMQHTASFLYVTRGLFGFPALAGRTDPIRKGEIGTGWLLLFHAIPLSRHTIHVVDLDQDTQTIRSREHGGFLRAWNHTLHVEPVGVNTCRYRRRGSGRSAAASAARWIWPLECWCGYRSANSVGYRALAQARSTLRRR